MESKEVVLFKIGGSVLSSELNNVVKLIKKYESEKILVICGYSRLLNNILKESGYKPNEFTSLSGIQSKVIDNNILRYSQEAAYIQMSNLMYGLEKENINTISITGIDCRIVEGKRKKLRYYNEGCIDTIDDDYSGKIEHIDSNKLLNLFNNCNVVCMTPVIFSQISPLVCDADMLALKLASNLMVKKLVIFTDKEGVIVNNKLVRFIKFEYLDKYINLASKGMKKKLKIIKNNIPQNEIDILITNTDNFLKSNNNYTLIKRGMIINACSNN